MNGSRLSRNDITELRELARSSSLRNEMRQVVVEGYRAISGAYLSGARFRSILVTDQEDTRVASINADKYVVDPVALERIATTSNPQHAVAVCEMPVMNIDDIVSGKLSKAPIFILDNVSDPGNVGTIIRSAVAFGLGAIITVGGCDAFHPKVVRSSAGTIFGCPILPVDEYELEHLLKRREVFAAAAPIPDEEGVTLDQCSFPNNPAVVFGNEAHGIITPYFENNTRPFSIPMAELCESLNVAMTATIVAYHLAASRTRKSSNS